MPFAPSSFLLPVAMPFAPSSFLLPVAMPFAPSSFLLPVAMPFAPSSFLLPVAMPFAPSSFLLLACWGACQVQYINYALARIIHSGGQMTEILRAALEDLATDKTLDVEKSIDAKEFNEVGLVCNELELDTATLLWWLVCIIEWQSGHRIFLSFMSELLRRTADLLNEADSTCRSLKTHITALQAQMRSVDDEGNTPEVSPEARLAGPVGIAVITSAAAAEARITAAKAVLEEIAQVKKEAEKLQEAQKNSTSSFSCQNLFLRACHTDSDHLSIQDKAQEG